MIGLPLFAFKTLHKFQIKLLFGLRNGLYWAAMLLISGSSPSWAVDMKCNHCDSVSSINSKVLEPTCLLGTSSPFRSSMTSSGSYIPYVNLGSTYFKVASTTRCKNCKLLVSSSNPTGGALAVCTAPWLRCGIHSIIRPFAAPGRNVEGCQAGVPPAARMAAGRRCGDGGGGVGRAAAGLCSAGLVRINSIIRPFAASCRVRRLAFMNVSHECRGRGKGLVWCRLSFCLPSIFRVCLCRRSNTSPKISNEATRMPVAVHTIDIIMI